VIKRKNKTIKSNHFENASDIPNYLFQREERDNIAYQNLVNCMEKSYNRKEQFPVEDKETDGCVSFIVQKTGQPFQQTSFKLSKEILMDKEKFTKIILQMAVEANNVLVGSGSIQERIDFSNLFKSVN